MSNGENGTARTREAARGENENRIFAGLDSLLSYEFAVLKTAFAAAQIDRFYVLT